MGRFLVCAAPVAVLLTKAGESGKMGTGTWAGFLRAGCLSPFFIADLLNDYLSGRNHILIAAAGALA